jgi:hypothetical protein
MLPDIFQFPLDTAAELNPTEGSATLLRRVRAMAATWQALAVVTSASYQHGQLSLFVEIGDFHPFYSESAKLWKWVARSTVQGSCDCATTLSASYLARW